LLQSLADDLWVNAGLDGCDLSCDPTVDVVYESQDSLAPRAVLSLEIGGQSLRLRAEAAHAVGAENAGGEEGVYQVDEGVLANVLPFAVAQRLGGFIPVVDSIATGVVGVPLA
jgi:hypothetical protein